MKKYELYHDSIAKQVLTKTDVNLMQRRRVKSNILYKYVNHLENNDILLSNDDLDLLRPYEDDIDWEDKNKSIEHNIVKDFIEQSKKNVRDKKRKEEINERRKIFLRVALVGLVLLGSMTWYALYQRNRAVEAEKLANLYNIENVLSSAEKFVAEENFKEGITYLKKAKTNYVLLESNQENKNRREVIDKLKGKKDSLKTVFTEANFTGKIKDWETLKSLTQEGNTLRTTDKDTDLVQALNKYKEAYRIDTSLVFLEEKIKSTEELIFEKLESWLYRAEQFKEYEQKEYAKQAFRQSMILYIEPEYAEKDSTELASYNARMNKIK